MGREIERKFLVKDTWRQYIDLEQGTRIEQGIIAESKDCLVRVRIWDEQGFITVKSKGNLLDRLEFESPLMAYEAREMLEKFAKPETVVQKIRYRVTHDGWVWEIDEYLGKNAPLVVAEIETSVEVTWPPPPPFVTTEVTQDSRYTASALGRKPFSEW
jgi:adenylate cyclase